MTVWRQGFALACLTGYIAAWWLALRLVSRGRLGSYTPIAVAVAGFGVPMMAADLLATSDWRGAESAFFAIWAACPLMIDGARWVCQPLRRRGPRASSMATFRESTGIGLGD